MTSFIQISTNTLHLYYDPKTGILFLDLSFEKNIPGRERKGKYPRMSLILTWRNPSFPIVWREFLPIDWSNWRRNLENVIKNFQVYLSGHTNVLCNCRRNMLKKHNWSSTSHSICGRVCGSLIGLINQPRPFKPVQAVYSQTYGAVLAKNSENIAGHTSSCTGIEPLKKCTKRWAILDQRGRRFDAKKVRGRTWGIKSKE